MAFSGRLHIRKDNQNFLNEFVAYPDVDHDDNLDAFCMALMCRNAGDIIEGEYDGGFESELVPLLECGYRLRIMRMKRSGCDFKNDSRGYVSDSFVLAASESGYDVFMVDFENDKPYAQFIQEGSTVALGLA